MTRYLHRLIIVAMGIVFLMSCSNESLEQPEQVELKLIGISQEMFDARYGNPIIVDDYAVKVNAQAIMVPDGEDFAVATTNQFKLENPDVILTSGRSLPKLAREGLLQRVDYLVEMNTEQPDGFVPSIMQKIRNDGGDGNLYGLPTTFSSHALYYNKDLFDKYTIAYPTDGLLLSEMLELERSILTQMARSEGMYGLLESNVEDASARLDQFIRESAMSVGIHDIDFSNRRIILDTDDWKSIWQEVFDANNRYRVIKQSNTASVPYSEGMLAFVNELSPVMLGGDYHWHNWIASNKIPFNWGVVTPPGTYNTSHQYEVIAISSDSSKIEAAGQLAKYMTSADTTKRLLSVVNDGGYPPKGYFFEFPARIKLMEEMNHVDLSAFYKQEPAMIGVYSSAIDDLIPVEFYKAYWESRLEHIQAILDGELTVEAAIAALQQEAQSILEKW